mmetsp:Transcript_14977/g.39522  ORF Transcript_14977/g.39522 Transcript_14977/m.39522 type:complete len:221 (-) Transcript_14977:3-665(-)
MRTNSGTTKPKKASMATRPCFSSHSRSHGKYFLVLTDKLKGSKLYSPPPNGRFAAPMRPLAKGSFAALAHSSSAYSKYPASVKRVVHSSSSLLRSSSLPPRPHFLPSSAASDFACTVVAEALRRLTRAPEAAKAEAPRAAATRAAAPETDGPLPAEEPCWPKNWELEAAGALGAAAGVRKACEVYRAAAPTVAPAAIVETAGAIVGNVSGSQSAQGCWMT